MTVQLGIEKNEATPEMHIVAQNLHDYSIVPLRMKVDELDVQAKHVAFQAFNVDLLPPGKSFELNTRSPGRVEQLLRPLCPRWSE